MPHSRFALLSAALSRKKIEHSTKNSAKCKQTGDLTIGLGDWLTIQANLPNSDESQSHIEVSSMDMAHESEW